MEFSPFQCFYHCFNVFVLHADFLCIVQIEPCSWKAYLLRAYMGAKAIAKPEDVMEITKESCHDILGSRSGSELGKLSLYHPLTIQTPIVCTPIVYASIVCTPIVYASIVCMFVMCTSIVRTFSMCTSIVCTSVVYIFVVCTSVVYTSILYTSFASRSCIYIVFTLYIHLSCIHLTYTSISF